ncbi:MAG TPA: DUF4214 domain-containing protein [Gemmataceae bacterium]|nr:DUF4214 domain-containing protein [Gemmataceae bacterium]
MESLGNSNRKWRALTRSLPARSRVQPVLEELESRNLPAFTGYTPSQMLTAYGFSTLGIAQPGLGQTIAIVEAFQEPQIKSDVATFDAKFNLPALNLSVVNDGATATDPTGGWQQETALDVEWAHAIAPYANIILVQAANDSVNGLGVPVALLHAATVAAGQANVHVVSMSWGFDEFSSETLFDADFAVPGVIFVAASGDNGAPPEWPGVSPNVLAVGGTTLQISASGAYVSEIGWGHGSHSPSDGGSGGGVSAFEPEPLYQNSAQGSGRRANPDVAYDGDPNTGVAVYDSTNGGWAVLGGTSAGTPQWAALVTLADQLGAAANPVQAPLNSVQTLAALYQEPADFHDIVSGNNGLAAGPGYDPVTGLGTPQADLLVPVLAHVQAHNQQFVTQVYQSLLGRTPDPNGLASWSNLLGQGTSRTSMVAQIEQSQEYLTDQVQGIYQKLLHRPADAGGLSGFTSFLQSGGTLEQVQAIIAGSDEYFATRAGGNIDAFLSALYSDALNRAIDPAGQSADEQALAGGMMRSTIAAVVFGSQEYLQDLVQSYYLTYLKRPPDSGGLAAFVAVMQQGTTDQQVIADILGSPEYFG